MIKARLRKKIDDGRNKPPNIISKIIRKAGNTKSTKNTGVTKSYKIQTYDESELYGDNIDNDNQKSVKFEDVKPKAVKSKAVKPKAVKPKSVKPKAVKHKAVKPKSSKKKADSDSSKGPSEKQLAYYKSYEKYLTSRKAVKNGIEPIIKDKANIIKFKNFAEKNSKINIHTLNFFKMYCIYYLDKYDSLPEINDKLYESIMKTVTYKPSKKGKSSDNTQTVLNELKIFYNEHYSKHIFDQKISSEGLVEVFGFASKRMFTNQANHIKMNFIASLNRYINVVVNKDDMKKTLSNSQIKSMIRKLKTDLLKNKSNADPSYDFAKERFRTKILKSFDTKTPLIEIVEHEVKYISLLPLMIRMSIDCENILISRQKPEDKGKPVKTINCFPLQTSLIPGHVKIDTMTLIGNFIDKDRKFYRENGNQTKLFREIWSKIFNIDHPVFKKKGYMWDRTISTDGVSCSIHFVRKDLYKENARNYIPTMNKPDGYSKHKYVHKLTEDELKEFRELDNLVGCDPGKKCSLACTDNKKEIVTKRNGKVFTKLNKFIYTNARRKIDTKSDIYSKQINTLRKSDYYGSSVEKIENMLCKHSASSCKWKSVEYYMDFKNATNQLLLEFYEREKFRKYEWYRYINRQRADANLINAFKAKFGPPSKTGVLMGDWSQIKQMKGCEPTKGKSMRKLFGDNGYKLCLVDEYNTSKKFCGDGQDLVNFRKYKDKLPKKRKRRPSYKAKQLEKKLAEQSKIDAKQLEAAKLEKEEIKRIREKETKEKREERKQASYVHRLLGSTILKSKDSKDGNRAGPLTKALYKESGYIPIIIHRDNNGSSNIQIKGKCTIFTGKDSIPEYLKRPVKVKDKEDKAELKENHPERDKTQSSNKADEYVIIKTSSKNCAV